MPGRGEIVMTIAEKLRNEGMEKGIEKVLKKVNLKEENLQLDY